MKPSRVWPRMATLDPASRGVTAWARNSSSSSRAGGPNRSKPRATRRGRRSTTTVAAPSAPGRTSLPATVKASSPGPHSASTAARTASNRRQAASAPRTGTPAGASPVRSRAGTGAAGSTQAEIRPVSTPVLPDVPPAAAENDAGPAPGPARWTRPATASRCGAVRGRREGALGVRDLVRLRDRAYGVGRSLWMYHGRPGRSARWRRFYARFVRPGDLCFDVGAHVGSRTLCWARLGARVVALEPQPDLALVLRVLCWPERGVTVLRQAVAARPGSVVLRVSPRTPTVTSGSADFVAETRRVPGFAWVEWSGRLEVPAMTLDRLVAAHGEPAFVKVDVEGMEHEVLAGLSRPLRALSFEFVPSSPTSALASVDRLGALGRYAFNVALGEEPELLLDRWADGAAIRRWLEARDPAGDSGDVYALRQGAAGR